MKIRPLSSLIGSFLGLKTRCSLCDEKSGVPTRLSSGTWTVRNAMRCSNLPSLSLIENIATLAQMDYTPSVPQAAKHAAYISAGSDASINEKGRSAGIAFEVGMTIERNDTMLTKVIANESFHIPVEDIDAAERIGVLVAMDLIRSHREGILDRITDAHAVLQPPIALHFDRDCLEQTLPQCKAFDFLLKNNILKQTCPKYFSQLC